MRILYICHRIPYPPNKGEKIRAFHQLRAMARRHEVDLFTLTDEPEDSSHEAALLQHCRSVTVIKLQPRLARLWSLLYLLTRKPLTLPYFYSARLQDEVRKALALRSYDRIFVYSSAMAQYVEPGCQVPMVLDLVDVDSDKWTQYASFARFPWSSVYRREGKRLRDYEQMICHRACCVLVSTQREANVIQPIAGCTKVHVVSNGVDTDFFAPSQSPGDSVVPTVTFTGDMGYFPNEQAVEFFARRVLPMIRQVQPEARFLIVGRNPSRKVLQLNKISGVEVTGLVPDVRTYLAQTQVSVAPFTIAAGIQNKILEALASGLPVVATSRTAQGLSASVAEIVEKADTAPELASKILLFLCDPQLARVRGMEGRRRVLAEYSWERALDRLLNILQSPVVEPVIADAARSSGRIPRHP